jgi:hypothetical protein
MSSGDAATRRTHRHRTVVVQVGENRAEIDEVIAPLIASIWSVGIRTLSSCEENWGGLVWIEFPTQDDITRFLNIVVRRESSPEAIYTRILYLKSSSLSVPQWEFEVQPVDLAGEHEGNASGLGTGDDDAARFSFYYSLLFPRCDIPILLERLQQHVARQ